MSEQHSFAVFGLGRFGTSIVTHLAAHDVELLAVDRDHDRVNAIAEFVDQAVTGSADAEELLARIGVEHYDVVVFAMGEAFESSVMATMIAKERGAKRVVVKALNERQAQILRRVAPIKSSCPRWKWGQSWRAVWSIPIFSTSSTKPTASVSLNAGPIRSGSVKPWPKPTFAPREPRGDCLDSPAPHLHPRSRGPGAGRR